MQFCFVCFEIQKMPPVMFVCLITLTVKHQFFFYFILTNSTVHMLKCNKEMFISEKGNKT